ncbi:MAG: DUF362 domain-containing protein [Polyangiaceae bacterium]|nr:DUF362 domain-containing protein [Polyangiaceae bacterium]
MGPREQHQRPSRRQAIQSGALSLGILGATALLARVSYQPDGRIVHQLGGSRQVRDFRHPTAQKVQARIAVARPTPQNLRPSAEELVRRAVDALGSMKSFVGRGDRVVLKPNIGWDRLPVHAANTNPRVVAEVVRQCFDAGASRVTVTDASCNQAERSFQRSGIWRAAYDAGAEVILPAPYRFRSMRLRGELLDEWPVYTTLIEADRVINLPIAKHHNLSLYTGAMKNWYGVLGGRRNRLHQKIHLSIADLATFMRPTLTILDATRVLLRNGPQGGNLLDAQDMHQVVASLDEVAADTYGAGLVGVDPKTVGYLRLGVERGLGSMDLTDLVLA